jgi:Protein of unknown function (DUF3095)
MQERVRWHVAAEANPAACPQPVGADKRGRKARSGLTHFGRRRCNFSVMHTYSSHSTNMIGYGPRPERNRLLIAQSAGTIRYGLHRQDAALMTCFTPSVTEGNHVHFIDGAGGGYAAAAAALKAPRL